MEETINGITVKYPTKGAPVEISGKGVFEGLNLFELYSVLRACYNDRNSARRRNEETTILRKIHMPDEKVGERLK